MLLPFSELFSRHNYIPKGIIHCGASTGQERDHYALLGISKVIWIEALPDIFEELKNNVAGYPENICINTCLADKDDLEVTFNRSNNEAQSSSFLELGTHKEAHPSVHYTNSISLKTKRLDTIISELSIDVTNWILVADLQGAEMLMLQGADETLKKVNSCYLEVNTDYVYKGCALKNEIEHYLAENYGFKPIEEKIYHQWKWGDEFFLKQ